LLCISVYKVKKVVSQLEEIGDRINNKRTSALWHLKAGKEALWLFLL